MRFSIPTGFFSSKKKTIKSRRTSSTGQRTSLGVESLEALELMSASPIVGMVTNSGVAMQRTPPAAGVALINSLPDATVSAVALADFDRDFALTRNDMFDIFRAGTNNYVSMTATAVASLETIVENPDTLRMPAYVSNLSSKVVFHSIAPGYYTDGLLNPVLNATNAYSQAVLNPNLVANEQAAAKSMLAQANNFFLGQVLPDDSYASGRTRIAPAYLPVSLPLFNGTPSYADVSQGGVGDCWLMASLAEVAAQHPNVIQNMFIDNGDGTYTVRFFQNGTADYVTVNSYLPSRGSYYDHPIKDLWVALAEKAYAQENGAGKVTSSHVFQDSYQALDLGDPAWALQAITGNANSTFAFGNPRDAQVAASSITTAFAQGQYIVMCTPSAPASSQVVPSHCYAMISYSGGNFILFNPWGVNGGTYQGNTCPGYLSLSINAVMQNFVSWTKSGSAPTAVTPAPQTISWTSASNSPSSVAGGLTNKGMSSLFADGFALDLDRATLASWSTAQNSSGVLGSLDAAFTALVNDGLADDGIGIGK